MFTRECKASIIGGPTTLVRIMRSLKALLALHNIALLQVIADQWGFDLPGLPQEAAARQLATAMLEMDLPREVAALSAAEQEAIQVLLTAGGRCLAAPFLRQFGDIRPYGSGRLVRERPWLDPTGSAEALWYRGLLHQVFEQTDRGIQEFVCLPDELLELLPTPDISPPRPALTPWPEAQEISCRPADFGLVDDCCTLLAYTQSKHIPTHPQVVPPADDLLPHVRYKDRARLRMLWALATETGLLHTPASAVRPHPEEARQWLQEPHSTQATFLAQAWLESKQWNDLWQVPSLQPDATGWRNDPLAPRQLMLDLLGELEPELWWRLDSLPPAVKEVSPDFQRTGGEYDAWYIKDADSGAYLLGFQNWDRVEGALLTYLVTGPLAWLGLVELGENKRRQVVAFRPTAAGRAFVQVKSFPFPPGLVEARIRIYADATITVPSATNRLTRFQVARLTDWEPLPTAHGPIVYRYRLTPSSLARAQEAGIALSRALAFLASRSGKPLPESVKRAVDAWESDGAQVQLQELPVLRVRDPAVLEQLQSSPKVQPLLGEALGPLAVVVHGPDWARLISAIAELGLLSEVDAPARES